MTTRIPPWDFMRDERQERTVEGELVTDVSGCTPPDARRASYFRGLVCPSAEVCCRHMEPT